MTPSRRAWSDAQDRSKQQAWSSGVARALAILFACACGEDAPVGLDGSAGQPFGERCIRTEDCASGLCLRVDSTRGVCTRTCAAPDDCPPGRSWGCVRTRELGAPVCGCAATDATEICGDERDNDCDGATDDCRICDGRAVPNDDPRHCGRCGNACRFDQVCSDGGCICANSEHVECAGRCVDLTTDADHCGRCGTACDREQSCVAGGCVCPSETPALCDPDGCVDFQTDTRHCGDCDTACGPGQLCTAGTCTCANPATPDFCPGVGCVDLTFDPDHCGECTRACSPSQLCREGTCACPADAPLACGASCVDADNDPLHCGGCDRPCSAPETCVDGTCRCMFEGHAVCSGACRDLRRDASNCGACGRACAPGERCDASTCVCDSGLVCGARCVVDGDPLNCGACGRVCPAGQICTDGECACVAPGFTPCGATCAVLSRDPRHCGLCDRACSASEVCSSASCSCAAGATLCSGACRDLGTDRLNCGACGRACSPAQACVAGSCVCPTSGTTYCASVDACVNTSGDLAHCGGCDRACNPTELCMFGTCRCPSPSQTYCASAGLCIDLSNDDDHCGACDAECAPDASCVSRRCVCGSTELTHCSGRCVDTRSDSLHCSSCGNACAGGRTCQSSTCFCPAPTAGAPVRLTDVVPAVTSIRAATSGTNVAVVWAEAAGPLQRAYLSILNIDGTPTTASRIDLGAATRPMNDTFNPRVLWTGSEYGVLWQAQTTTGEAWLHRYTVAGAPIATARRLAVASPAGQLTVFEFDHGTTPGYALLYGRNGGFGYPRDLWYRSFGATGATPGTLITAHAGADDVLTADMAVDPAGRVMIVLAESALGLGAYAPYWLRLASDGTIAEGPRTFPTSPFEGEVSWDGMGFIAAYNIAGGATLFKGDSLSTTAALLRGAADAPDGIRLALRSNELEILWLFEARLELQRGTIDTTIWSTLDPPRRLETPSSIAWGLWDVVYPAPGRVVIVWASESDGDAYAMPIDLAACP